MALPTILANFKTSFAAKMSDSASAFTLNTSTDPDGTTLSGNYFLTFDEGTSSEEHCIATMAGAAGTVVTRGVSKVDAKTNKAANQFEHTRGASVKITNISLIKLQRLLEGDDDLTSTKIMQYDAEPSFTPGSSELSTIKYADDLAIAGAPDSSATTKGIVEMATSAESQAGTDSGSTTAPLTAAPSDIAANVQNQEHSFAADAEASDAYVITLAPAPAALAAGQRFVFTANTANTTGATLNVNALGAAAILKHNDQALETGDIEANQVVDVIYNGTAFEMQTPVGSHLTTAIATETTNFFSTTDATGAEMETLTDGSNSDALHIHTVSGKVTIVTADTTVGNTTDETNLLSISIPANTLSTANGIKVEMPISVWSDANAGPTGCDFALKYGATTLATAEIGEGESTGPSGLTGKLEAFLLATGATNSQEGSVSVNIFGVQNTPPSAPTDSIGHVAVGTAAEDSTGALNLVVTVKWGVANAGNTITIPHVIVTTII